MLSKKQQIVKRLFDVTFSFIGVVVFCIPILILIISATFSTNKFGLFSQLRVGQNAKFFSIYKIRTMKFQEGFDFITLDRDSRVTSLGNFLRTYKLDELPQLVNVLIGNMSFVGPRPDVVGYADKLEGEDRVILTVKPGITGPATLKYRNEEKILSLQPNPKRYNDTIIWNDKIEINKRYVKDWSLLSDFKYIIQTIFN